MVDIEAISQRYPDYLVGERVEDIRALVKEVRSLRAELLEEQTVHAKTMDNFEAEAESWLEERTRLLDRYARMQVERDHARDAYARLAESVQARDSEAGDG